MSPKSTTAYEPLRQQGVATHQHPQQFNELENGVFDPQPFPAAKSRPPSGLLQRLLLRPRLRAVILAVAVLAIGISLLAVLPSRYHMIAQPGLVEIGGASTKNLVGQGSGSGGDSSSTVSEGSDTPDSSADLKTPVYPALEVGDALASISDEEDGDAQVNGSKAPSIPEPQPSDVTGGGVTGAVTADEQADQLTSIRMGDATSDDVGNPRTDGDGADQKHLEGDLPGSPISRNGDENLSSSSTIPDLLAAEKTNDPDKSALAPSGQPASARPGEVNEDNEDDEIDGTDISVEDAGSGEGDGTSWTISSGGGSSEGSADEKKDTLSGEGEEGSTGGGVGEEPKKTVPTNKNDDVLAAKPDPESNASDSNEVGGELGGEASDVGDEQQKGQLDQAGTKAGPALTPSTSASPGDSGTSPEPAGAAEPSSESGTPSPAIGGLPALADDDENSAAETRPAALEGGHVQTGTKISADNDAECLLDDGRLPTTGSDGAGAVASAKPPAVVNPLCGATTPDAQSLPPLPLPASPPAPASPVDNAVAASSAVKGGELDAFKGGAADIPADDAGAPSGDKENEAKSADNIDKLVNVEGVTSEDADNNDESDSAAEKGTSEDDESDSAAEDIFEDAKDDEGDSTEKTTSEGAEDDERDSTMKGTSEGAVDDEWDSSQRIGPDNAKDDESDSDDGASDEGDSDDSASDEGDNDDSASDEGDSDEFGSEKGDSDEGDGDEGDSSRKIASENKEDDEVDSSQKIASENTEDDEGDSAHTIASKDAAHGEVGSPEKYTSKKTEDNNGFSAQMLAPDDTEDQDGDSATNVASEHDEVESAGKAASKDAAEDDGDSAEKVASDDADHDQVGSSEKVASDDADHNQVGSAEKVVLDDADHNQVGSAEKVASDDAGHDQMRSAGKIAPKDAEDGQGDGAENDASENAAGVTR